MNVSSSTYDSSALYQQMASSTPPPPPSAEDLATEAISSSDTDGDGLLSLEELGLSEEDFNSMDSDGDGSLSSEELQTSISSMLDSMKDQSTTPEEFGEFLTSLGLDVPPPPPSKGPDASQMASDVFSSSDTDGDGILTAEELDITDELFSSIDEDGDGQITQEELETKISSMFEDVKNGEMDASELEETLSALGIETPSTPPAPPSGGGAGGSSSSDEEYDVADTNQDGTVSDAEYAAYYGTSDTTSSSTSSNSTDYTMQLVSTLIDAVKAENEANGNEDGINLSQFKQVMSMVNNQTQDSDTASKLESYLSNLAS